MSKELGQILAHHTFTPFPFFLLPSLFPYPHPSPLYYHKVLCIMCIATWVCPSSGPYAFVYASNRDELVDRPTQRLGPMTDAKGRDLACLAGKDIQGGGTWLGTRRDGRFAALTNFRSEKVAEQDQRHPAPGSTRGTLIVDALSPTIPSVEESCQRIADEGDHFNGFSLVVGDLSHKPHPSITSTSNHGPNQHRVVRADVPDQIYVLSNTSLDHDEHWPKMSYLRKGFSDIMSKVS